MNKEQIVRALKALNIEIDAIDVVNDVQEMNGAAAEAGLVNKTQNTEETVPAPVETVTQEPAPVFATQGEVTAISKTLNELTAQVKEIVERFSTIAALAEKVDGVVKKTARVDEALKNFRNTLSETVPTGDGLQTSEPTEAAKAEIKKTQDALGGATLSRSPSGAVIFNRGNQGQG